MSKKKILFIIDSYKNPYAGTEGQLLKLINGLDKAKYSARLVVFRGSTYLESNKFPIPVDTLKIQSIISLRSILTLFKYFKIKRGEGFRLAHMFFNDASIICPPILKLLDYKVLISRRDMGYWYNWLNLLTLRINSYYVDGVVVNSQAVKDITVKKENYPACKVRVIYNGYQQSAQDAVSNPLDDSLEKRLINHNFLVVLVANIRPIKRIGDAIHAIHDLSMKHSNVGLCIVGDGDQTSLKEKVNELGVNNSVHLLGARNDVVELLPNFDVGILCSESEGFSNTLIEYSQAGLPIVCSDVGGNSEIIDHGINGFLYDVGNIEELTNYLEQLSNDKVLRETMGLRGKEKVINLYGLSEVIRQHQALYEEVLSGQVR